VWCGVVWCGVCGALCWSFLSKTKKHNTHNTHNTTISQFFHFSLEAKLKEINEIRCDGSSKRHGASFPERIFPAWKIVVFQRHAEIIGRREINLSHKLKYTQISGKMPKNR
jgi:hypothetical protein